MKVLNLGKKKLFIWILWTNSFPFLPLSTETKISKYWQPKATLYLPLCACQALECSLDGSEQCII